MLQIYLVNEWTGPASRLRDLNSNELLSMCYQMEKGSLVVFLAQEICRYARHVSLT
jgi:hypothetical protein